MTYRGLKAKLIALKLSASKVQKELIDLILAVINGKSKVTPNKTLDRLIRLKGNRPIVHAVLVLLYEFIIKVGEHKVITHLLEYFGL